MDLRTLFRSKLMIVGVPLLAAIAWIAASALADFEASLRKNTEFSPNFTEAAFQTIKKGDSAETILEKLGQPAAVMLHDENTVHRILPDRPLNRTISNALLSYSRSFDETESFLMRFVSIRKGQVEYIVARWGTLPGGID